MGTSSTRYIFVTAAVVLVAMLIWNYFLVAKRADVIITPTQLAPDGRSTATVRLALFNRAGYAIPFRHPSLSIEILQGQELARFEYMPDSTVVILHAGYQSGRIEMNVHSKVTPFPLFASLTIAPQLAEFRVLKAETSASHSMFLFR